MSIIHQNVILDSRKNPRQTIKKAYESFTLFDVLKPASVSEKKKKKDKHKCGKVKVKYQLTAEFSHFADDENSFTQKSTTFLLKESQKVCFLTFPGGKCHKFCPQKQTALFALPNYVTGIRLVITKGWLAPVQNVSLEVD